MSNVTNCLDSLSMIDDSIFFAECDVIDADAKWNDKITEMLKYCNDTESMTQLIQESTDTTGVSHRDPGVLDKIITFIRRCVAKIVDTISDFLVKVKTRNFEYIMAPYNPNTMMDDLKTAIDINKRVLDVLKDIEDDPKKSLDDVKKISNDLSKIKFFELTKTARQLRSAYLTRDAYVDASYKYKDAKEGMGYGIKPELWMKMREEIRGLNRTMKDTESYLDKSWKRMNAYYVRITVTKKDGTQQAFDTRGDKAEDYSKVIWEARTIYTKLAQFTTKIMQTFRFKNATQITPLTKDDKNKKDDDKKVNINRNDEKIFKDLEEDADRLTLDTSYLEEKHGDYIYRLYGDGRREKVRA